MNGLDMLFCSPCELALWRGGQGGWAIVFKHREVVLQRPEAFCSPGRGSGEMQAHVGAQVGSGDGGKAVLPVRVAEPERA